MGDDDLLIVVDQWINASIVVGDPEANVYRLGLSKSTIDPCGEINNSYCY